VVSQDFQFDTFILLSNFWVLQHLPSSPMRLCLIRLSPIVKYSLLLPLASLDRVSVLAWRFVLSNPLLIFGLAEPLPHQLPNQPMAFPKAPFLAFFYKVFFHNLPLLKSLRIYSLLWISSIVLLTRSLPFQYTCLFSKSFHQKSPTCMY
jgi:hypothetical protein